MPTTFYVSDTDGNDGQNGESPGQAKKTIGSALGLAGVTDGDIIEIIDEATYDDESQLVIPAHNLLLTHTASELGRPVIDFRGSSDEPIFLGSNSGNTKRGFKLNGIEIEGPDTNNLACFDNSTQANRSAGMVISDCFIHGYGKLSLRGEHISAGETYRIESSSFMFSPSPNGTSINFSGPGEYIINNCFISKSHDGAGSPKSTIDGFHAQNDGHGAFQYNTTASFCTFIYNSSTGAHVGTSTAIVHRVSKVVNCVVRGGGDSTIDGTASNTRGIKGSAEHNNNVVFNLGSSGVPYADSGGTAEAAGTDDLTSAVTFVNGNAIGTTESVVQSFALAAGSVGIDQGTAFSFDDGTSVNNDINGTSRPQGSAPDMGAFEFIPIYWQETDNNERCSIPFQRDFTICHTANKMATRAFPAQPESPVGLRQAPYYVTIAGPPSLRGQTPGGKPYKVEE